MERNIVCFTFNGESIICSKQFPSGKVQEKSFSDLSVLWEFIKGCDLVFYGGDFKSLLYKLIRSYVEYDFTEVNLVDILELEEYLNPRSLEDLSVKYSGGFENSNKAILDVFAAQKELANKSIEEIELSCKNGRKRLDSEGRIILKDGVATWNEGKIKGTAVVQDLSYAQRVLDSNIPAETKNVIKKLFKR